MKIIGIILIVLGIVAAYPLVGEIPSSVVGDIAITWIVSGISGIFAILTGIGFLLSTSSKSEDK